LCEREGARGRRSRGRQGITWKSLSIARGIVDRVDLLGVAAWAIAAKANTLRALSMSLIAITSLSINGCATWMAT
jgi:hypothetical protein